MKSKGDDEHNFKPTIMQQQNLHYVINKAVLRFEVQQSSYSHKETWPLLGNEGRGEL